MARAPVAQRLERRPPEPGRLSVVAARVGSRAKPVEFCALCEAPMGFRSRAGLQPTRLAAHDQANVVYRQGNGRNPRSGHYRRASPITDGKRESAVEIGDLLDIRRGGALHSFLACQLPITTRPLCGVRRRVTAASVDAAVDAVEAAVPGANARGGWQAHGTCTRQFSRPGTSPIASIDACGATLGPAGPPRSVVRRREQQFDGKPLRWPGHRWGEARCPKRSGRWT